jgi:hypothetical protein
MNLNPLRFSLPSFRLLAAMLCCLPLGSACSDDEVAPAKPLTFSVEVTGLDGVAPDVPVALRCDSNLAVSVSIASDDAKRGFVLRPAHACGSSTRCGYVHIEGLASDGQVLSAIDTATTEGVLPLSLEQLPTELRISLIRGLDQTPLLNPDKTEVVTLLTPSFVVPTDCEPPPIGAGGAGGAGGASSAGAAGTAGAGGDSSPAITGGAGGVDSILGGAGGVDSASSGAGGA